MKHADLIIPSNNDNTGDGKFLCIGWVIVAREFIVSNLKAKLKEVWNVDLTKKNTSWEINDFWFKFIFKSICDFKYKH